MFATPLSEHEWLQQFVGQWKFRQECNPGPGIPNASSEGTIVGKSLGGLWYVLECTGKMDDSPEWTSQFHLGYDPARQRFVGSFIASVMYQLWLYDGRLSDDQKTLVLDTEGPAFDGNGTAKYQDIFEIIRPDYWRLRSQMLMPNGEWLEFMLAHHERVA